MPSIGPEIPPHLLNNHNDDDDDTGDTSIAPALVKAPADDDDSEDDYAPELPPDLAASQASKATALSLRPTAGPSIGPSLPPSAGGHATYSDDDDDDDVGPRPLPAGITYREPDAVAQFMQKEENRKKNEASKPKALKRDEWMLVPPSSSDLLANLDPTKLSKGRQFSRSTAPPRQTDNSLWTETPAERQQRLADEVSGKKRRAVNADNPRSAEEELELRKRQRLDDEIRSGVEAHSRNVRGAALVDRHAKNIKDEEDPNANAIWDHGRDMGLGGRLMDDASRAKMLKDAKSLGDRFGSGSKGGFL